MYSTEALKDLIRLSAISDLAIENTSVGDNSPLLAAPVGDSTKSMGYTYMEKGPEIIVEKRDTAVEDNANSDIDGETKQVTSSGFRADLPLVHQVSIETHEKCGHSTSFIGRPLSPDSVNARQEDAEKSHRWYAIIVGTEPGVFWGR